MEPDNRIWANPDLLKVWIWCLVKANYADKRWISFKTGKGRVDVSIERGQFICGRHSAGHELGVNPSTVRDRLKKLAELKFIEIDSSASQYSKITICNYGYYQGRDDLGPTTKAEAIIQSNNTSTATTKKLKNDNNEKNIIYNYMSEEFENISQEQIKKWESAYPAIDIKNKILQAGAWLGANPKNKKKDFKRFLNNWLIKAQERAPRVDSKTGKKPLTRIERMNKALEEE
jgi:hypothetical protein